MPPGVPARGHTAKQVCDERANSRGETRGGWIAFSGLLFVAAWIIGLLLGSPPTIAAPTSSLIAYYHANAELIVWQAYLISGVTGILLLVYAAALHSTLRTAQGETSTLSNLLLSAGVVAATLSCLKALFVLVVGNLSQLTRMPPSSVHSWS